MAQGTPGAKTRQHEGRGCVWENGERARLRECLGKGITVRPGCRQVDRCAGNRARSSGRGPFVTNIRYHVGYRISSC